MHLAAQARTARPPLPLRVGPHESQAFSMLTYFYGAKHPTVCLPPTAATPSVRSYKNVNQRGHTLGELELHRIECQASGIELVTSEPMFVSRPTSGP